MNRKPHEPEDVIVHPGLHEGDGAITRRRFFNGDTKLPVRIEVWELDRELARAGTFTKARAHSRSSTTSSKGRA